MEDKKQHLSNKMAVLQVLACVIKDPLLLLKSDYKLSIDDFTEQFHRIVFGAVEHLALQGVGVINYIDIDQFLSKYPTQYKVFNDNKGIDYVQQAVDAAEMENFPFYYNTLKKYALLNKMIDEGFDINLIYDTTIVDPVKAAAEQQRFDKLSLNDIINVYDNKILTLKEKFGSNNNIKKAMAGDGLAELIESFKETPDMGLALCSPKLTTLYRGQRLKKFYMESAAQGSGKSRHMAMESAHLAIPEHYDAFKKKWVKTSYTENVLYISTELELSEVQTIWLAYVAGVPENKIRDGQCNEAEQARLAKATQLIQAAKLYFVQISDYDMDDIENLIKQYWQLYQVNYVYYDYLSTTIKIMASTSARTNMKNQREDQILLMFATKLKDLCNNLGIFIWTATQLSGDYNNSKNVDQQLLRGAKALADKTDIGAVLLPIREADKTPIQNWKDRGFTSEPTHVIHLYKARAGQYHNIKIYIHYDTGLCQMEDCFVTNADGQILDIADTEVLLDQTTVPAPNYGFNF